MMCNDCLDCLNVLNIKETLIFLSVELYTAVKNDTDMTKNAKTVQVRGLIGCINVL